MKPNRVCQTVQVKIRLAYKELVPREEVAAAVSAAGGDLVDGPPRRFPCTRRTILHRRTSVGADATEALLLSTQPLNPQPPCPNRLPTCWGLRGSTPRGVLNSVAGPGVHRTAR